MAVESTESVMAAQPVKHQRAPEPTAEESSRADLYGLIANLFYAPPSAQLLRIIENADGLCANTDDSPLCAAWRQLRQRCRGADLDALRDEYETLFIGVGRGLVMPYASYYLAGFMMEKPLARLRSDLAALGLARRGAVHEPEDHIAAICDVMRRLIAGGDGRPAADLPRQREFFDRHLKPWYVRLHQDLQSTDAAVFYRHAGEFAKTFFDLEVESFDMD